jgi:DNA-binding transcriptional LysR family regulator
MARDTMGLTVADLEALRILAQAKPEPRSYSAAAEQAGYDRARLARLIERVNQKIGVSLDWRENGRFRPPPEVRRLILRYTAFAQELDDLGRAPRVSAGTCATFLLGEVLVELGRKLPRLAIVRSRDALDALERDEIDIALVHGSSLEKSLDRNPQGVMDGVTSLALVGWETVVIRQDRVEVQGKQAHFRADWEPDSMGERLNQEADIETAQETAPTIGIPCQSFLHAIELVRRGLIAAAVIPDIYLPKPALGFVVGKPAIPTQDQLAAIFRTAEGPRWAWLLDRSVWERVVKRSRST